MMRLGPHDQVFHIGRLRRFGSEPFSYEEAFLQLEIGQKVAKLDLRNTAIIHELRTRLKLKIWEEHQQVEAVAAEFLHCGADGRSRSALRSFTWSGIFLTRKTEASPFSGHISAPTGTTTRSSWSARAAWGRKSWAAVG